MAGASILKSRGRQDSYFTQGNGTGARQTLFQNPWYPHSDFAILPYTQDLKTHSFGETISFQLDVQADALHRVFLQITLPEIRYTGSANNRKSAYAAWTEYLGYALVQNITAKLGTMEISGNVGELMQIKSQVGLESGIRESVWEQVGQIPELSRVHGLSCCDDGTLLIESQILMIPLDIFFTKHIGNSLPLWLGAVSFRIATRNAEQLLTRSEFVDIKNLKMGVSVVTEQITLSDDELAAKQNCSQQFLIVQNQISSERSIPTVSSEELAFSKSVKALYWTARNPNYRGKKFMGVAPMGDASAWEKTREQIAKALILSRYDVDEYGYLNQVPAGGDDSGYIGANEATYLGIDPSSPEQEQNYIFTDSETQAAFEDQDALLGILSSSEHLLAINTLDTQSRSTSYDLGNKVAGVVRITLDPKSRRSFMIEVDRVLVNELTMEDLSIPIESFTIDNRNKYVQNDDLIVWQHFNTGMLLDGSRNPIAEASIRIGDSADLVSTMPGIWFNKTVPSNHCHNTPAPGVCVHSFAIDTEEFQPNGSANMSNLKKVKLNLTLNQISMVSPGNLTLNVYAENLNVLTLGNGFSRMEYDQ